MAAREAYSRRGSAGPCLGPRKRKFVGPLVSRVRGTADEGRRTCAWAFIIALSDQHRVAVGVEAIALGDGVSVRAEQRLAPAEGGSEQQASSAGGGSS